MSFSERFIKVFRTVLPTPFTIAVGLTVLTFWIAWFTSRLEEDSAFEQTIRIMGYWKDGIANAGGLKFAMQMMLMLVLGHVLALTKPVNWLIDRVVTYCTSTAVAAGLVTFLTVLVALFNWGLGLIFGAIFARKVGEHAAAKGIPLNYALVGAAGYSGLMVWHGGISGSALAKVNEPGHLRGLMEGLVEEEKFALIPEVIDFGMTVFSPGNVVISLALLILLPLGMYFMGERTKSKPVQLADSMLDSSGAEQEATGAERLDYSRWIAMAFSFFILGYVAYEMFFMEGTSFLRYFKPDNINFLLLGLAILLHGNFYSFLRGVGEAMGGATGILIQFPLYFGIMGIMRETYLVNEFSAFFVELARDAPERLPFLTFLSAGIVNVFVPSGGGQWAVQGPIIIQAAVELGVSLPKSVLALAYGDQLTNMLQPFWALPLLGITGLKAKQILPYTLYLMLLGAIVFLVGLWLL